MLHETYTSCIKPDGIYEGKTIKASDVIELQRGGTGMLMLHHAITQSYTNSGPFYLPSTNKDLGSLRAGAGFCQQDTQSWLQIFDLCVGPWKQLSCLQDSHCMMGRRRKPRSSSS